MQRPRSKIAGALFALAAVIGTFAPARLARWTVRAWGWNGDAQLTVGLAALFFCVAIGCALYTSLRRASLAAAGVPIVIMLAASGWFAAWSLTDLAREWRSPHLVGLAGPIWLVLLTTFTSILAPLAITLGAYLVWRASEARRS